MTDDVPQPPADPAATPEETNLSFEQAIERLESLIERIESGEVGLEAALQHYERGTALIRHCRSILDTAQRRIEELTLTPEGGLRSNGETACDDDDQPEDGNAPPAGDFEK